MTERTHRRKLPRINLRVAVFTSRNRYRRAMAAEEMYTALKRVWSDDNAGSLDAETTLDYVAHAIAKGEGRYDDA